MVELVDTLGSGSSPRKRVGVRVPFRAQHAGSSEGVPSGASPFGHKILFPPKYLLNEKMYIVYAIRSLNRNYIYVGLKGNLTVRFKSHNKGTNKTTKPYKPFRLIFTEEFESRAEARQWEKYYKSGVGKEFIKQL